MKCYLITGFLGAGKTSFLKEFVKCFPNRKIALIINEFGRINVDSALLSELHMEMTGIENGSIFCACRAEQFRNALTDTVKNAPDIIIIEASGLSDPTNAAKLMREPEFACIDYKGAICLVDGARFHKVYKTARVCKKQLAAADIIIINKVDLATPRQINDIKREINAMRPGIPVFETTFGKIDSEWLDSLTGSEPHSGALVFHAQDITLQKCSLFIEQGFTIETLSKFLSMFAEDTYRIKGFVLLGADTFFVDCVGPIVQIFPWNGEVSALGQLAVLFGHGMPARKSIQAAVSWYPELEVKLES